MSYKRELNYAETLVVDNLAKEAAKSRKKLGTMDYDKLYFMAYRDGMTAALQSSAPVDVVEKLLDAVKTVTEGYQGDGMENMRPRDEVFYEYCCKALAAYKESLNP